MIQHRQTHGVSGKDFSKEVLLLLNERMWVLDSDSSFEAGAPHRNQFGKPRSLVLDEVDAFCGDLCALTPCA